MIISSVILALSSTSHIMFAYILLISTYLGE